MILDGDTLNVSPTPDPKGTYEHGTLVTLTVVTFGSVDWEGVVSERNDRTAETRMTEETFINVFIR